MIRPVSRRLLLGAAVGALAGAARAAAPAVSLRPQARPDGLAGRASDGPAALVAEAGLSGQIAFAVVDARTGDALEGLKAQTALPPASVTKAVTALYALDTLGAGFRFGTRLMATGPVRNGVLQGDLVLAGGGDPTLDTDALADMAARLANAGVREVRGRFRVWEGALPYTREIDPTQPAHAGYNPALSGLSLNYNRVHFEWKRNGSDYRVTMDARSARFRPEVRVARIAVADRSAPVYIYADGGAHDSWTVARGALGNGGARWLPVRKPALYAGEVFTVFARAHGIVLDPPQPLRSRPGGTVLVTHRSAPLRDILREMLRYSTNLTAELVGMTATARRGNGRVASLDASARDMSAWARRELGLGGAQLVDHSGLGEDSRLTAAATARALAGAQDRLRPILRDFPLRHENGQINHAHAVKVAAKTGTLYFVSALAGYMTAPDGTDLAFAIFTGDTGRRAAIDRGQDGRPPGARGWNGRAKRLQQKLIERWGRVYGS